MQTKIYREQHGRIRAVVREIVAMETAGASELEIRTALARLTGTVKIHLGAEDASLYPRLLGHPDAGVRTKAAEFQNSMGGLAAAYIAFTERWLTGTGLRSDRAAFFAEFRGVAEALATRMDREDAELYAMADRELAAAV